MRSQSASLTPAARALRQEIIRPSVAPGIPDAHRKIPPFDTHCSEGDEVICRGEPKIRVYRSHRVIARMIIGVGNEGIEEHPPEELARICTCIAR